MSDDLSGQLNLVEKSLGESMIETAMTPVRLWMHELGEGNPFEQALADIRRRYQEIFTVWLNIDDPAIDEKMVQLTGDAYQLADAVYAQLRLKRGLSPRMHGFNPQSPHSVINYFENCIELREPDLEWLRNAMMDEEQIGPALVAIPSLTKNLRECFSIDAISTLIEGFNVENKIVANQCIFHVITLFIHYDIRMGFFPQLEEAFADAVRAMGEDMDRVFEMLCTIIPLSRKSWIEDFATGMTSESWLPDPIRELIDATGIKGNDEALLEWAPKGEKKYLEELVKALPETWIYEVLVQGNPVRERYLAQVAIDNNYVDFIWDYPDIGEIHFRDRLRQGSKEPIVYLFYAHCLMLKGDRMMAFEYYKQVRQLCKSLKEFHDYYRPYRGILVDHGVPVEYIYLMEDNLIEGEHRFADSEDMSESDT